EESEVPIQPCPAPPLPSEAMALARARQVAPHLLLHPLSDIREAATRVAERKVLDPAPQHGIDTRNHLADRLGPMAAEDLLERAHRRRPLLALGGAKRHPSVSPTANSTDVKAQKSEALALRQVHPTRLLLVHLDVERCQFLTKSSFNRRAQPALSWVSIDK